MTRIALLLLPIALSTAQSNDPHALLIQARGKLADVIDHMPRYTCTQTVDRSYYRRFVTAEDCDRSVAEQRKGRYKPRLIATDRVRLDVAVVESGAEVYSWAGEARLESVTAVDLVGGPFTTGSFAMFLADIFLNDGIRFDFIAERALGSGRRAEYRFRVPAERSHYRIEAGPASRIIAYDGKFELDTASGDLTHLSIRTAELPVESGSCEAASTVDFERTRIGEREVPLATQSSLQFIGRNGGDSENTSTFTNCHEYHAESMLRFDGDSGGPSSPAPVNKTVLLPAGLRVVLALKSEIDTSKAAAGDVVVSEVRNAILAPDGKKILVRRGATVRSRIVHMEHFIGAPAHFLIALLPETIEVDGSVYLFPAEPAQEVQFVGARSGWALPVAIRAIQSEAKGAPGGRFIFARGSSRLVVRRGFESNWVTGVAKKTP